MGGGLWEVRSSLRRGTIARILFCVEHGRMMLLHGFVRKTQKTPQRDPDLALKRKQGRNMKNKNIGSSFDSWLREEGIREEVTATAVRRVLARQVQAAMAEKSSLEIRDGSTNAHQPRVAGTAARSRLRRRHTDHPPKSGHGARARTGRRTPIISAVSYENHHLHSGRPVCRCRTVRTTDEEVAKPVIR
jgi:hypothetical protein